jgi:MipA family protein
MGAIVVGTPQYPGSDKTETRVYPLVDSIYKDEFFFRSDQIPGTTIRGLGLYLYHQDGFDVTASLAPSLDEREKTENVTVQKLGDVAPTVRAAFAASYTQQWWSISSAITRDLSQHKREGVTGGIDLTGIYHVSPSLMLTAGPGFMYGNSEYMNTFFGVNANQSAQSGLPVFTASGGVVNSHFRVGGNYHFNSGWNVGLFASEARLAGDAGNSPVIESRNQFFIGTYCERHF